MEAEMRARLGVGAIGLIVLLTAGCASMMGLPQGSVLVGDYQGSFNGKFFWGTIEVQVYEAPGGARPVFGRLKQEAEEGFTDFRGQVTGNRMEAGFTIADGTVSGELSPDGRSMTGSYRFTDFPFDQGTWKATRR
jgi:hypothetical protein